MGIAVNTALLICKRQDFASDFLNVGVSLCPRTSVDKDQQNSVVVNVGNILTGNAAVVVPTAAPSLAGISDMDLQAAFLARFGSVGVQNAGHYARNSGCTPVRG